MNNFLREFAISIYLFVFSIFFKLFSLISLKDKVTFVVTFEQNSLYVLNEIYKKSIPVETVFLYKKDSINFQEYPFTRFIRFENYNVINQLKSIYHLATSKYIFVDNYYGFLSSIKLNDQVMCIQLWHAGGAVKRFGLKDKSIVNRSARSIKRFQRVYNKFHKVVVGSDEMGKIFKDAFGLKSDNILPTGIPRTDFFFDKNKKEYIKSKLITHYPVFKEKKVILYAPTYRDNKLNESQIYIDLETMQRHLNKDYILLLRFHPAVSSNIKLSNQYNGFVYDFSKYPDVNELLLVTDILITDYSSIPFEFALLNKPMIFFPYDLEEYEEERGFWTEYVKLVPGPIVKTTDEIIRTILNSAFDLQKIEEFSKIWNKYSTGKSSENIVNYIFEHQTIQLERKALEG